MCLSPASSAEEGPPPLRTGDVHLWSYRLDQDADPAILSADERDRAARLILADARRRFIAGRAGLRRILGRYVGVPPGTLRFVYGAQGKPALADFPELHFNLAHSADCALLAAAAEPVGVDVERVRAVDVAQIMPLAFTAAERAALDALPAAGQIDAFFRAWVRKEALMKGLGAGFALAQGLTLPITAAGPTHANGWTVYDLPVSVGYVAAVALRAAHARILYPL